LALIWNELYVSPSDVGRAMKIYSGTDSSDIYAFSAVALLAQIPSAALRGAMS